MIDVLFVLLSIVFEVLFVFAAIKSVKPTQRTIKDVILLFGITVSIFASGILQGSVFRYLLLVTLCFVLMRILYKSRFYDIYMLNIIWGFKFTLEFLVFMLFYINNIHEVPWSYSALVGLSLFTISIILWRPFKKLYDKIVTYWNKGESFYLRYILLISLTAVVMFTYYIYYLVYKNLS